MIALSKHELTLFLGFSGQTKSLFGFLSSWIHIREKTDNGKLAKNNLTKNSFAVHKIDSAVGKCSKACQYSRSGQTGQNANQQKHRSQLTDHLRDLAARLVLDCGEVQVHLFG